MTEETPGAPVFLPFLAVFTGVLSFMALLDAGHVAAGGVFEYPLDAVYLHLAVAEQIWQGGYGVNAGEYAAATSSALYPVLLVPFAGSEFQHLMPLIWNVIGLILASAFWGRILWQAGYGISLFGFLLALCGPLALHMSGLAFTGTEHSLHLAASLAIISGLLRFASQNVVGRGLYIAVFLAPLIRPEGVVLGVLAALFILLGRRIIAGIVLLGLAVIPFAGFAYWLGSLGLDPQIPLVFANLSPGVAESFDLPGRVSALRDSVPTDRHLQVLLGFLCVAVLLLLFRPIWRGHRAGLLIVVIIAGALHAVFGRFGLMERFEIYIIAVLAAAIFAAAGVHRRLPLLPLVPLVFGATVYAPLAANHYPASPRAVYLQQIQMARFATDHLGEAVGVNDVGAVAWQNPHVVLDLWGSVDQNTFAIRQNSPEPGWAGALAKAQNVRFAMIYDPWFENGIGPDWTLLGTLHLSGPQGSLGARDVSFYLTGPYEAEGYIAKLNAWKAGLPSGASFAFAEGGAG